MSFWDFLLNPPQRAFKKALRVIKEQRYEEALPLLDVAIEKAPSHYPFYFLRGLAYQRLKQPDKALADYNKALSFKPDHGVTLNNRGIIHQNRGEFDRAEEDYTNAIKNGFDSHSSRGELRLFRNDLEGARSDYEKALELSPNNIPALILKAHFSRRSGDDAGAVAILEKALEIDPLHRTANNNLAWALATCHRDELRNGERALGCALKAVGDDPEPPLAYAGTLAAAYAACGRFEDAIKWASNFLERNPPEENREPALARLRLYQQGLPYREPAGVVEYCVR